MKEANLQEIFESIGGDFALLQRRKGPGLGNDFGTSNILKTMFESIRGISLDLIAADKPNYFPNGNLHADTIRLIAECLRFLIAINNMED